jgi:VWFA-related protein
VFLMSLVSLWCLSTQSASTQQPTFRSAVDLIAVDVQVVNRDGAPVDRLGPQAFEVSIKGQRRRVISAEFVRHAIPAGRGPVTIPTSAMSTGGAEPVEGRTIVLAFDTGSFAVGAERPPVEAMLQFLAKVNAADRIGLWTFPRGTWIPPTTERAPLRVALSLVVGGKQPLWSTFHLRPAEIVDITAESTNPHSFLTLARGQAPTDFILASDPVLRVQRRECPADVDCPIRIYQEGMGLAAQIEHEVQESLSGIELLLRRLAAIPGRKSVVLVSAGLMVSDRLEGRPDVGKMAETIGQMAARANTTVYTIHFDQVSLSGTGVGAQRGYGTTMNIGRDRALFGTFLDQFSDGAGGKRLYVPTGQGDFAFDQVLRESSGYYLLGVEPDEVDRDGQPRRLEVKVSGRGLTLRSRQWVVVPAKPAT